MPTTDYFTANGMLLGEQTNGLNIDYVPDALGSVVAAVDQNLNTTYTAAYRPYGDVVASTGTAPNFTWLGQLGYLVSAGRPYAEYSVRARLLSSKLSRWTSIDPLWPVQPAFRYARVSPVSVVDVRGLYDCSKGPPTCQQIFASYSPADMKNVGYTTCCVDTGTIYQLLNCATDPCAHPCLDEHENVHADQYKTCCANTGKCWQNANGNTAAQAACQHNWQTVVDNTEKRDECSAYNVSALCYASEILAGCGKNPPGQTLGGGTKQADPCCSAWVAYYQYDSGQAHNDCALAALDKGHYDQRCPYDSSGNLLTGWPNNK